MDLRRIAILVSLALGQGACASCKTSRGSACGVGAQAVAGDGGGGGVGIDAAGDGPLDDQAIRAAGVRWFGRVDLTDPDHPRFGWSGTGLLARFIGSGLSVSLTNAGPFVFKAVVDGQPQPAWAAVAGTDTYALARGLPAGPHTVALYRQTEGVFGDSQLAALTVQSDGPGDGGDDAPALLDPPRLSGRRIDIYGASVSCGYGDLGASPCGFSFATESSFDTYAGIAARLLDAELNVVAISGRGVLRNSDGTTDGTIPLLSQRVLPGAGTPTWDNRAPVQAVVINLGKNDLATGDPGQPFVDAYAAFARTLRGRYPGAIIVAATGPNLGAPAHALQLAYVTQAIARRQAEGDDRLLLLDWPEETPAEEGCDGHPNAAKHQAMGEALAALLAPALGW
jgi:lysophospholipase L1-like esterase